MLICQAEIDFYRATGARRVDVRIEDGCVHSMATQLAPRPGEAVIDAQGQALLPGLHDHHLHLAALAVALDSLSCGPPEVVTAESLADALQQRAARRDDDAWIRGLPRVGRW